MCARDPVQKGQGLVSSETRSGSWSMVAPKYQIRSKVGEELT